MLAAAPEVDLNPSFSLKIVGIERYLSMLFFASCGNQKGIAYIIVMKVEGNFVVPILVRRAGLAN